MIAAIFLIIFALITLAGHILIGFIGMCISGLLFIQGLEEEE